MICELLLLLISTECLFKKNIKIVEICQFGFSYINFLPQSKLIGCFKFCVFLLIKLIKKRVYCIQN